MECRVLFEWPLMHVNQLCKNAITVKRVRSISLKNIINKTVKACYYGSFSFLKGHYGTIINLIYYISKAFFPPLKIQ